METKMNIYLKNKILVKNKTRKHVCFLLFVLGIFMLPLLLMCQCCGRDLHLATHATILWCCPRMYQHEIKKTFGYFFIYIPWGNAVWYSCLTLRKLLHLNCLDKYLIYFIPPHTWTSISTMKSVWSFGFVEYHNLPEKQMCLVSVFFPPFFALIEIQHGFPLWSKWAQKNIYIYIWTAWVIFRKWTTRSQFLRSLFFIDYHQ